MNILYLCDEYPPGRHGGIGTAVQLLAREMSRKGHRVVVAGFYDWGYDGEDEFNDEGVKVFRFRRGLDAQWFHKKETTRVRATYKLFKMLGIFQYDIERSIKRYERFLHELITRYDIEVVEKPDFNEYMQYCLRPVFFPVLPVPTIVKLHGTISYFLNERNIEPSTVLFQMEKQVLDTATALCSVSQYTAGKTAEYFGLQKKIDVVYNGIRIMPLQQVEKIPFQAIYTGSLVEKKGIYQLAKAWNIVAEREPRARLLVLGKGNQERVQAYLSAKAKPTVIFKGHVAKEVLEHDLASSMVAIFPSYAETFGLAAAEAMAAGVATIFSTRTSGPEVIRNGIDGLLTDPDNVEDMAANILLLFNDSNLRKKLATEGREKVKGHFAIEKIADVHIALYSATIQGRRQ